MTNTTNIYTITDALKENHVFLSVESTDLNGRIIKIQIVDDQGNFLLNTLVHPRWKIKENSTAGQKHRITNAMVKDAPRWKDLLPTIKKLTDGKKVFVYNAGYINSIFYTTSAKYKTDFIQLDVFCLMEVGAELEGTYNHFHGSHTFLRLDYLCHQVSCKFLPDSKALTLFELATTLEPLYRKRFACAYSVAKQ